MFRLQLAATPRRLSRLSTRTFAELVPTPPTSTEAPAAARRKRRSKLPSEPVAEKAKGVRVPVREDHGLYSFFRRRRGDNLTGEDRYEVVETPDEGRLISGRAWEASELRLKSFKDLHTLWYVAAREQNLLASQKEEVRRMGSSMNEVHATIVKVRNCRKTMARIKAVLNERRLAYEGALKLAELQMAAAKKRVVDEADQAVMEFQRMQQEEERPKAKVYRAQRRNLANGQKTEARETRLGSEPKTT